ncbi:ankyrin repeat-containing domain protein, partial [Baffinella frigidus]
TALFLASLNGHEAIVRLLLSEYGAEVAVTTSDGRTPLHIACLLGRETVAHLLIAHGADVSAEINDGAT